MAPHWRWLALGKQLLHLCSAPGLTFCILSGFIKHCPQKLSAAAEVLASPPLTHRYQDCLVRQIRGRELPVFLTGAPWGKELLGVTGVVALRFAQPRQVVTHDTDSSSDSPDSPIQVLFPLFSACFCSCGSAVCCCGAATCHFWGDGAVKGPTLFSIHLLQFQLSERKRSGLIFQRPLTVNGMRGTSPESSSPCHEEPAKAMLEEWPFGSVQLSQREPCCSLALGSSLPNYYSKPFPEYQYWFSGKGL